MILPKNNTKIVVITEGDYTLMIKRNGCHFDCITINRKTNIAKEPFYCINRGFEKCWYAHSYTEAIKLAHKLFRMPSCRWRE